MGEMSRSNRSRVMKRYILRYTGSGSTPAADVAMIEAREGVRVLDKSGRMVLVEATEEMAHNLGSKLTGWVVDKEVKYPVPDTHQKPRSAPDAR